MVIIYPSIEKLLSEIDFGPWEVPKLENLHFHFPVFSGWGTSRGPKLIPKAFFKIKFYIITLITKFLGAFQLKK